MFPSEKKLSALITHPDVYRETYVNDSRKWQRSVPGGFSFHQTLQICCLWQYQSCERWIRTKRWLYARSFHLQFSPLVFHTLYMLHLQNFLRVTLMQPGFCMERVEAHASMQHLMNKTTKENDCWFRKISESSSGFVSLSDGHLNLCVLHFLVPLHFLNKFLIIFSRGISSISISLSMFHFSFDRSNIL